MAAPGFEKLLRTQELDTRLAQLAHAREHHKLRGEIAALRAHAAEVAARVRGEREERHSLERDQKRLDDEVAMLDAKRGDIETKLYDGSVTATKDLLAMQEESKHLLERKSSLEDAELEIMERIEELQLVLDAAQGEIDDHEAEIDRLSDELEEALAILAEEADSVTAERERVATAVPSDLLQAYDSLRAGQGGVVVARLEGGACQACHLDLSSVTLDKIGKMPADAIVHCDQCGALLVR